jgi:hypothetical protein
MVNWQSFANAEAQAQGCDLAIVLAIEAETNGTQSLI